MTSFVYVGAKTKSEAVNALAEHGEQAVPLAGGTALLWAMRRGAVSPTCVVDLCGVGELRLVSFIPDEGLHIGAAATIWEVENHEEVAVHYPAMHHIAAYFAPVQVRATATVVGNICNAAPSADFSATLLALGAQVIVAGPEGERTIAIQDFFTGPWMTALGRAEIVTEIVVPVLGPHEYMSALRHASHEMFGPSIVGAAAWVRSAGDSVKEVRIGLLGVGPQPVRALEAELALKGQELSKRAIDEVARIAQDSVSPVGDFRASAEYRQVLTGVYVRRVLMDILTKQQVN